MREIKFRAWDLDFKKMWLPHDSCFEYLKHEDQQASITGFMMSDSCHLMQFTGLKDKDGVEIYEGDILLSTELDADIVVEWSTEGAYWSCKDAHDGEKYGLLSMTYIHKSNREIVYSVIGNIYENLCAICV